MEHVNSALRLLSARPLVQKQGFCELTKCVCVSVSVPVVECVCCGFRTLALCVWLFVRC